MSSRHVSMVLFDGFELLDVFGPVELFSVLPDQFQVSMVGPAVGPVPSSQGTRVLADQAYPDAPTPDIVMLPGGKGTRALVNDAGFLDWLGSFASEAPLITSVCTGSAVLAAAGLLEGYQATSNKRAFAWAAQHGTQVDWQPQARWVEDRNRWTSSGVAAGMDMTAALIASLATPELADKAADAIELEIHRDPGWDPFAKLYGLVKHDPETSAA